MDKLQLKRQDISEWKKHPVSGVILDLLAEHIKGLRDMAAYNIWTPETVHRLYTIQGQLLAMDSIRDIDQFLEEKLTIEEIKENVEEDV